MTETIYGAADVAQLLHVTKAAISNYRARFDNTPPADYITPDGRLYWTADSMALWLEWQRNRVTPPVSHPRGKAFDVVEKLREQLDSPATVARVTREDHN